MVPPKKAQTPHNQPPSKVGNQHTSDRFNSSEKRQKQPQGANRDSSLNKMKDKNNIKEEYPKYHEADKEDQLQPDALMKLPSSKMPPQNVKPISKAKTLTTEKLVKPPRSSKQVLKPMESMDEGHSRSSLRSDAVGSKTVLSGTESRVQKLPALDSQMYKLFDKIRKLTESNSKLTQEATKLRAELLQAKQSAPLLEGETKSWNVVRDRQLKSELLRLRAENYKLKSSLQLNDRFGEVVSRLARDSESICDACVEATRLEEDSDRLAIEVLSDVMSKIIKMNSTLQSAHRDYLDLKGEQGVATSRDWDCNFAQSDAHSVQLLTERVCGILFDLETENSSILNSEKMKEIKDAGIIKEFHDSIVKSSQALLAKSFILMNFSASKKSTLELKKKMKTISTLDVGSQIVQLEKKLQENLKNFPEIQDGLDQKLMTADLQSFFSMRAGKDDPQLSLYRMSGMLIALDFVCKTQKLNKRLVVLEEKLESYLARIDSAIAESVREMINFLDRTGFSHEVYLGYRYKVLNSLDKFFKIEFDDRSGWTAYLEELLAEVRGCQVEFSKDLKQDN